MITKILAIACPLIGYMQGTEVHVIKSQEISSIGVSYHDCSPSGPCTPSVFLDYGENTRDFVDFETNKQRDLFIKNFQKKWLKCLR